MSSPEESTTGPVVRDRRRIDPVTGQVRDSGQQAPAQQATTAQRGPGKGRPGKHAASKPGGTPGNGGPDTTGPQAPSGTGPAAGGAPAAGPGGQQPQAPGQPTPQGPGQPTPQAPAAADQALAGQLAERTADLQRVSAEYANYRKRVDRDRLAVREQALANVLSSLLPVLDDIGRAREHGELTGGFKSVADSLESAVTKLGLVSFGEEGEPFDPNVHEALMHSYSAEVTEPSCVRILQPGYRVDDRVLRPARVAVAEPGEPADGEQAVPGGGTAAEAGEGPGAPSPGGQETRADDD